MSGVDSAPLAAVDLFEAGMIASGRDDDETIRRSADELRAVPFCYLFGSSRSD